MNSPDNRQLENGQHDNSQLENGKADRDTLEHLLGVIAENRQQRCAEVIDVASIKAKQILGQTHSRVRERMHRHIASLRDRQSKGITTANAKNQSLISHQHQLADRHTVSQAWPMLHEAMLVLWNTPLSRDQWLDAASRRASSTLLHPVWKIEHPADFTAGEQQRLVQLCTDTEDKTVELIAAKDIQAGIRIIADGTVVDATLEGLLQQKTPIQSRMIACIKQQVSGEDSIEISREISVHD